MVSNVFGTNVFEYNNGVVKKIKKSKIIKTHKLMVGDHIWQV